MSIWYSSARDDDGAGQNESSAADSRARSIGGTNIGSREASFCVSIGMDCPISVVNAIASLLVHGCKDIDVTVVHFVGGTSNLG